MSMYTDPDHLRVEDPGKLEGNTVFTYLDAFCKDEYFAEYAPEYANLQEMKDHYTRGGLGDVKVKKFLNNVLQETLEPIRQKRAELEKNIPYVYEVLRKGTEAAEEKAARTLDEVRHDMMIDYFSGDEWLVSQEKKFAEQRAAADAADVRVKRQRAAEARKKAKAGAGQN